jgi:hypothetical protein
LIRYVPSPPRGEHDLVVVVAPGDEERVPHHGARPGETGPADVVGEDGLDDDVEGRVVLSTLGDGDAVGDAAPVGLVQLEVGREGQARVGVVDAGIRRGLRRGWRPVSIILIMPFRLCAPPFGRMDMIRDHLPVPTAASSPTSEVHSMAGSSEYVRLVCLLSFSTGSGRISLATGGMCATRRARERRSGQSGGSHGPFLALRRRGRRSLS